MARGVCGATATRHCRCCYCGWEKDDDNESGFKSSVEDHARGGAACDRQGQMADGV